MPHIHTGDNQHDLTVTAYIVRIDTPEPKVLLHMHRKLGVLLPVGGHVELSETPWQAVAHELTEESGYLLEQLNILQPVSRIREITGVAQHPYPISMNTHDITKSHFHTDIEYAFVASSDPAQKVADGESTDVRWLSSDELTRLPDSEIFKSTKDVYRFVLDEALNNPDKWEQVPTGDFSLASPEIYAS